MYNRLFTKILDSSIWLEPTTTRIVWITLLAAMDENGYAHFSAIENLASRARIPIKETEKAVEVLSSPDPNSANPDNDGRRIERIPGGFIILNAEIHRGALNREIRREQTRIRVANHRAKKKSNKDSVTQALRTVTPASECTVTSSSKRIGDARGKEMEEIYQAYPKKVRKPDALRAISKALQTNSHERLLERTRAYAATQIPNDRFTPNPATWFNGESFNDDPETWAPKSHEKVFKNAAEAKQAEIDEANRLYAEKKRRLGIQ